MAREEILNRMSVNLSHRPDAFLYSLRSSRFSTAKTTERRFRRFLVDEVDLYPFPAIGRRPGEGADAVDYPPTTTDDASGILLSAVDLDADAARVSLSTDLELLGFGHEVVEDEGNELERHLRPGVGPTAIGSTLLG